MVSQQKYSGRVSRRTGGVTAALDARRTVLRRDGGRSMQLKDAAASPGRTTRRPTARGLAAALAALGPPARAPAPNVEAPPRIPQPRAPQLKLLSAQHRAVH